MDNLEFEQNQDQSPLIIPADHNQDTDSERPYNVYDQNIKNYIESRRPTGLTAEVLSISDKDELEKIRKALWFFVKVGAIYLFLIQISLRAEKNLETTVLYICNQSSEEISAKLSDYYGFGVLSITTLISNGMTIWFNIWIACLIIKCFRQTFKVDRRRNIENEETPNEEDSRPITLNCCSLRIRLFRQHYLELILEIFGLVAINNILRLIDPTPIDFKLIVKACNGNWLQWCSMTAGWMHKFLFFRMNHLCLIAVIVGMFICMLWAISRIKFRKPKKLLSWLTLIFGFAKATTTIVLCVIDFIDFFEENGSSSPKSLLEI